MHFILGIKTAIIRKLLMHPVWGVSEVIIQGHPRRRTEPAALGIRLPGAQGHGATWSGITAGSQLDLIWPSWSEGSLRVGAGSGNSFCSSPPAEGGSHCTNRAVCDHQTLHSIGDSSVFVALNALLSRMIADRLRGNTHSCIVLFPPWLSTSCLYCEKLTFSR